MKVCPSSSTIESRDLSCMKLGEEMGMHMIKEKLSCALTLLQSLFQKEQRFILGLFFMNYFTMAWSLWNANKIEVMIGYGFTLFLAAVLLAAVLQLLRKPLLIRIAESVLVLLCFIPFFVESFVMYNYKALLGVGIINSLLETNQKEAVEFLKMYVGLPEVLGAAVLLAAGYFLKRSKLLSCVSVCPGKRRRVFALLCLFSIGYTVRMLTVYTGFFYDNLLPLQRAYASTQTAVDNMQAYRELSSQVSQEVELTKNDSQIKNIVFILGESTNRNHMHLYGYELPTTPKLDQLNEKGEISVFRNVVSPHSTTIAVLSKLFTFCDHESEKPWYEYNNLIDIMNTAGYKTHWLSNQESSGIWGNVAQIYADHSAMHRFTRIRDSKEDTGILDEELFPLIDEAIENRSQDKNFYVVHLMGGHGLYYNRFPYSFYKFTKDDIHLDVPEQKKEVVAQYDDAIYYNDYIVSSIIDKFRDTETLVIYVPDHGEAVYDDGGFAGHIEENPNRHMIEIPVIMWASDKFKTKYPEKWAEIQAAVNRPYMTDDMIHTVLDLSDIQTVDFNPAKSIVNASFDASRPRIFNDLDYDKQILTGNVPEDEK